MKSSCGHEHVPIAELRALTQEWREDYGKGSGCPVYHAILALTILHCEHEIKKLLGDAPDRKISAQSLMAYFNILMTDSFKQMFPEIGLEFSHEIEGTPTHSRGDTH